MPAHLNLLLTTQGVLDFFRNDVFNFEPKTSRSRQTKATGLIHLKKQLSEYFFNKPEPPTSEEMGVFAAYPQLRETLDVIYALDSTDELSLNIALRQLEGIVPDWNADGFSQYFDSIDARLGYFTETTDSVLLKNTFKELAILCRTAMVVLEENNAIIDAKVYDTAYHMMALCIADSSVVPRLDALMRSVNALIDHRDKKTKQPIRDIFLQVQLPRSGEIKDRLGWLQLIKKEGERALPFFTEASKIEAKRANRAPRTIPEAEVASALVKYARGEENPAFAALCYAYDKPGQNSDAENGGTLENVFNKGLDYMATGWPKKTTDALPNLIIQGTSLIQQGKDARANYYWVKLPPSDQRALILGKITDCCQSIGGNSEQCVKDGVSLEDNGFYVLLKHKRGDARPIMEDGRINYDNFQMIGQSYVWRSTTGDVCLDSIECLSNSIPEDMLNRHSSEVFNHFMS